MFVGNRKRAAAAARLARRLRSAEELQPDEILLGLLRLHSATPCPTAGPLS